MSSRAALLKWCLDASVAFTDDAGHHFAKAPIAVCDGIIDAAIADAATPTPLLPDAVDVVALLLKIASRESGYHDDAQGDYFVDADGVRRAHSCGLFQSLCTWPTPLRDPTKQAAIALKILHLSFAGCPDAPLAIYASGRCSSSSGRRISRTRLADTRRVLAEVPVSTEE